MSRGDPERLDKDELTGLVLKLQRQDNASRTFKPPSTHREGQREQSRLGSAKPGHDGRSCVVADDPDMVVDHRPTACPDCDLALSAKMVSVDERFELPKVERFFEPHRRLTLVCSGCRARVSAPQPTGVASTPFGPRLHATAAYLKTFQPLSYERPQNVLWDFFGPSTSQGGLTGMLRRAETRCDAGRDAALPVLRHATVVAFDEMGVNIEGTNSYEWVFRWEEAVVHHAGSTRGACVVHEIMDGHRSPMWQSDRYSAQQGHADQQQTCMAYLAYALEAGDDTLALLLQLWSDAVFALARTITSSTPSTVTTKRRKLNGSLDDTLAAPATCDPARDVQNRKRRARDQPLTFTDVPGRVEATDNAYDRDLRPAGLQRKHTDGYRTMWSAKGEAAVRIVVGTARITSGPGTISTMLGTIGA